MSNNIISNFPNANNSSTKPNGCAVVIIAIILLLILFGCYSTLSEKKSHKSKCYWCGMEESCHMYDLQYIDGYNPNGSFKFEHKIVFMSSKCADDARKSGKYTNVTEC